jgi:pimeloyl-ACP methyl ester carboxylesterase
MSRPPSFALPPGCRAFPLRTSRGTFAAVESPVAAGAEPRGTVLLLPGFTGSKEDFHPLHPPLAARGYRTVAVDGRGQYESDGPENDESAYAQAELARDVVAQAEAVGAPLHLLGHSLGGQIARAAVLLDRAPFRSLTLMSSGPAEISTSQRERVKLLRDALAVLTLAEVWDVMRAMEARAAAPGDTGTAVGGVVALDAGPTNEDDEDDRNDGDDLRRRWLATRPAQLIATGRQLSTEPDRVAELAATGVPCHVLSGARDDTWPVPLLDDMARRLGAHRTVVAGAEHSPNTDRPARTARALAGFWDGVGA